MILPPVVKERIDLAVAATRINSTQPAWEWVTALAYEGARIALQMEHEVQCIGDRLMAAQTAEVVEKAFADGAAAREMEVIAAILSFIRAHAARSTSDDRWAAYGGIADAIESGAWRSHKRLPPPTHDPMDDVPEGDRP